MTRLTNVNLKVLLMDSDYYALQAINSYLAWDRRTRVICMSESIEDMWRFIDRAPAAEHPDIIVLDANHLGGVTGLRVVVDRLHHRVPRAMIIFMAQTPEVALVEAASEVGARGFLLKGEVRLQIAWAIVFALDHDFIITPGVAKAAESVFSTRLQHATLLPRRREYPELTDRIRQAIELCVVKGMPAHLAADEMGISLHTIRSYIKEGYRILEAYDDTEYPVEMSPQERAFMRLTSFTDEDEK